LKYKYDKRNKKLIMDIRNANVFDDMKTYEDYKFNTILTDPPYQLGSEWFIDTDGLYKIKGKAKDFMNKWDGLDHNDLDLFFQESFRTLKYGGYLLMFGLDRQLGPLHYYATKNGFEINQSLYWYFVSNFPKATDAGKMIDKRLKKERKVIGYMPQFPEGDRGATYRGMNKNKNSDTNFVGKDETTNGMKPIEEPASDLSKIFDGYKYSKAPLKQMVETIMVFSKPTKNKSVLDDLIEWGEGTDLLNYSPKVGKKERNNHITEPIDNQELNTHPTLKPIKLIKEISSLFKLPEIVNQQIYVPFSGSFSEICALVEAGYNPDGIYGCELNEEYYNIGLKRLDYYLKKNGL
jgi:site-specific DNA-methyltransferase (adenine-specific)